MSAKIAQFSHMLQISGIKGRTTDDFILRNKDFTKVLSTDDVQKSLSCKIPKSTTLSEKERQRKARQMTGSEQNSQASRFVILAFQTPTRGCSQTYHLSTRVKSIRVVLEKVQCQLTLPPYVGSLLSAGSHASTLRYYTHILRRKTPS